MVLNANIVSSEYRVEFESGFKISDGAINIVSLYGSWREMGRQYGRLLSQELFDVYQFAERYVQSNGSSAVEVLLWQWNQISYSIREFFEGVAETSGLTLAQLHRANAVERVSGLPQCSAAFAWNNYTDGKMVIGRNYDYGESFFELKNDVVVTVFHPGDGSIPSMTIGYAGEIYAVNAYNKKGIFFELNTGKPSTMLEPDYERITGTTLLFNMIFQAHSMDYVDAFFKTSLCSESYVINASDIYEAISYEWCQTGMKKGNQDLPKGLLVSTNHYLNPEWQYPVPTDRTSWNSFLRRNNLIQQCEKAKGKIDLNTMMDIISTSEDIGGTTNEFTVYQFVMVPEDGRLCLKIINASEWVEIDINSFM